MGLHGPTGPTGPNEPVRPTPSIAHHMSQLPVKRRLIYSALLQHTIKVLGGQARKAEPSKFLHIKQASKQPSTKSSGNCSCNDDAGKAQHHMFMLLYIMARALSTELCSGRSQPRGASPIGAELSPWSSLDYHLNDHHQSNFSRGYQALHLLWQ